MSVTTFILPFLGEKIAKAHLVRILVKVGDVVTRDQSLIEVETEKASVEVPADRAGRVTKVLVEENSEITVGQALFEIEETTVQVAPLPASVAPSSPGKQAAAPDAPLSETPAAAATPALPDPAPPSPQVLPPDSKGPASSGATEFHASPSIRKLARELGVDLTRVVATGPDGRITPEDVKATVRVAREVARPAPAVSRAGAPRPAGAPTPTAPAVDGEDRRETMSRIRELTAEHMARCWTTIPHVTQFDRADITELEELRKRFGTRAESAGGKLTVTATLVKVVAAALRLFPKFNASVAMESKEIVLHRRINIGVAVDTDRGLLVPVIRDADTKSILQIAIEMARLAEAARTRKIAPDDLKGGTFTITNLGGIGGTNFTPIVNSPEVAILGVARSGLEPVFNGNIFQPRTVLPLALSYDHRLIDGADGARFLRWIVETLQQPFLLSLEVS